jgi:hypothetical protein
MTTTVPRRHRRDNREAARNFEDEFTAMERAVAVELAARPAPPAPERVARRDRPKLPVARPAMKDPKAEIRWAAGHVGNRVAHHTFRLDLHARTFWCSTGRGTRLAALWVWDYVQMPKRQAVLARMVAEGETKKHAKFAASYEQRKKKRLKKVGGAAAILVGALAVLVAVLGMAATMLALFLIAPPILAVAGRRGRAPAKVMQIDTRPVPLAEGRPSPELVHAAFAAVGIDGISCEIAPHREGPGWECTIRIPVGTKAFADAVKAHGTIAGNLGTGSEGLFLERGATEKHVIVWWSKQDPFAGDPVPHPVLDPRSGPADLWKRGIRLGIDQRGTEVRIPAVDTPFMVIGGQQGAGKTFSLFGIGAEAGADPIWDLDCWSFKPSNDFAPLEPLVRACGGTFRYGADTKTFDAFLRYLKALRSEVIARNERLADLPYDLNPRAKVERNVAADPRNGMRPRIVIADEIQTVIPHPGVLAELIEINRIFRSQNVVMILGMQFVDSVTIEQLQRLLGTRICLSVARHEDSKGVLGGAHEPGIAEGHKIPLTAKAVAIVAGALADEGQAPRGAFKMRHYGIPSRQALADHIDRCLAGPRAGQSVARVDLAKPDPAAEAFRSKVADLFGPGETALTCMELGQRLGLGQGPRAGRDFGDLARKHGLEPQVDGSGKATGSRNASFIALDQLTESA